jgi:para-nitrobenzyl esterase
MKSLLKTRAALTAILAVLTPLGTGSAQTLDPLAVQTASGPVTGVSGKGVDSWLGVPYAKPPIGALRWQPPQSNEPWTVLRKANTLPSSCPQNAELGVFARAGGNEDCLYLNVYKSAEAPRTGHKLPVFVWIHGGSLWVGQGADYDPAKIAVDGKAIVVTINYRLGAFGFFAHPAIDREEHASGNYGLMDQQAALRWVQQNIAAFGGDPADVTIAGESSGGNSVMAHVASPTSAGLFQHAIAMSGAGVMTRHPGFGAPRPLEVAQQAGAGLAKALGCEPADVACLRSLPTKRILDAQSPYTLNEFVIDGQTLPIHPADAFRTGRVNKVTLVNGTTRDEGRFFIALPELLTGKPLTEDGYPTALTGLYGAKMLPQVLREYPLSEYVSPSEAYAAASTDSMFACTARALDRSLSDKMPVYAYEFGDRSAPSYVGPTSFPMLAAHTYELAYLFPGFRGGADVTITLNPLQEKLSDEMVGYFAHLSQIASRESTWPRYDAKKDNFQTFLLPNAQMVSGRFAAAHHCDFWDKSGLY